MRTFSRKYILALTYFFSILLFLGNYAQAESSFVGIWQVKDSDQKVFSISLKADGSATADRGEGMVGSWEEKGDAAIITWKTGWKTKIMKDGKGFKKAAFKQGQSLDSAPTNTSEAKKIK